MSRDPWVQRFDERADEDDRYARRLEAERAERAAEKGDGILGHISSNITDGGMTIEEFERSVEAGLRQFRGPKVLPPYPRTQVAPPRPARRGLGGVWRCLKIFAFIVAALVLAAAVGVTIIEVVAWGMSGP